MKNYFGPTPPYSKLCKTILVQPPLFKTVQNYFGPKGEARTHGPRAPSVPRAKLGHSNRVRHRVILPLVMAILGFLTIPWLGPKDTEPRATSVPKLKKMKIYDVVVAVAEGTSYIYIVNTLPCTVMHPHGTARVYNSAVCGCGGGN